jgi:hypothetical protein
VAEPQIAIGNASIVAAMAATTREFKRICPTLELVGFGKLDWHYSIVFSGAETELLELGIVPSGHGRPCALSSTMSLEGSARHRELVSPSLKSAALGRAFLFASWSR